MCEKHSSEIKLVIFDMDGTILDTLDDIMDSVNYALNYMGYPSRTKMEIKSFVGNGRRKLIERAAPQGLSETELTKIIEKQTEYYLENSANNTVPFDGILELMKNLKEKKIHIAVHTNKGETDAKNLINKYFEHLVEYCIGSRENLAPKPSADGVIEIMNYFQVSKAETIYIGDSDVDIETAINTGIDAIIVDWGFREKDYLTSYINGKKEHSNSLKIISSSEELLTELLL